MRGHGGGESTCVCGCVISPISISLSFSIIFLTVPLSSRLDPSQSHYSCYCFVVNIVIMF